MENPEPEGKSPATPAPCVPIGGASLYPGLLGVDDQTALVAQIRDVVAAAPLFSPLTSWGKPMSVRMTSAGKYGWYSDRKGYRYLGAHPAGMAWPPIPDIARALWQRLVSQVREPDCCLVNFYREGARMGLHQDRDEADFRWPVLSISLGDDALFRIGGSRRDDPTQSVWLRSGDVLILGGPSRLAFHGIDRTRPGSSTLLDKGGRINLTLRVVD